jgi:murein DD-endopeptidase
MRAAALALAFTMLTACAPFQPTPDPPSHPTPAATAPDARGLAIAETAKAQLGAPYQYGGAGPLAFDCSGLVSYVHRRLGIPVPRTAAEQFAAAQPVERTALRPGDLVFFRIDSKQVSHVGVYIGAGRFVHAPRSGRPVGESRLDDAYFVERWAGAGTFN